MLTKKIKDNFFYTFRIKSNLHFIDEIKIAIYIKINNKPLRYTDNSHGWGNSNQIDGVGKQKIL